MARERITLSSKNDDLIRTCLIGSLRNQRKTLFELPQENLDQDMHQISQQLAILQIIPLEEKEVNTDLTSSHPDNLLEIPNHYSIDLVKISDLNEINIYKFHIF